MDKCQFCSGVLGATARFCSNCGNPVTQLNAAASEPLKPDTVNNNARQAKVTPSVVNAEYPNIQLQLKIKKPNSRSVDAIDHTLFVVSENFYSSFQKILTDLELQAAGTLHSRDPALLAKMAQQFIRNAPQGAVEYVCIIGNWSDVPPSNIPNDFMDHDGDEFCQTDAFYGATEDFDAENPLTAVPEITVGRIPVANQDVVQRILSNDPDVTTTRNSFQFGVTAQCWEVASREIISSFLNIDTDRYRTPLPESTKALPKSAILSSPDWTEEHLREIANRGPAEPYGLIFFNVHGGADEPHWVGEGIDGDYVGIFQPGTIRDFNSAIVLSEACYGGAMFYDGPSIVEHFFANGGNSFVGSSTIAYGARATPLSAADLIATHYITSLYKGLSQGEALKLAKLEALTEDPLCVEYGLKTALSFNLFGAPWQTLTRVATSVVQGRPARPGGSVLNRVRSNLDAPIMNKNDAITKVRERYRDRLPPRQRQFLVEKDKILAKLREFHDFSRIIEEIEECRGSLENSQLDFVSVGDAKAYRLFCKTGGNSKSNSTLMLMINSQGHLTKTLVSKEIR